MCYFRTKKGCVHVPGGLELTAYEPIQLVAAPPGWRAIFRDAAAAGGFSAEPVVVWAICRVTRTVLRDCKPVPGIPPERDPNEIVPFVNAGDSCRLEPATSFSTLPADLLSCPGETDADISARLEAP